MAAKIITLDTLNMTHILMTRDNPAADVQLRGSWTVADAEGRYPQTGSRVLPANQLTAPQQTALNALWDKCAALARSAEGLP